MPDLFDAGGAVGRDLRSVDWSATPLGPPDRWPQSLRTAVRILLTSKFSMWMAWGSDLTFFCNEAYRRDTLGGKYPWALGRPASEVWSEIWPDIGPRIDQVITTGEATWDESLMLFLERSDSVEGAEETYHTFSYSPLADDQERVAGMLCVVSEETRQVVESRRMATLRDLGTRSSELTEDETIAAAGHHLERNPWCLPFTLTYRFDATARTATLAGSTGFRGPHPAAPATIAVGDPDAAWPTDEVLHGREVLVQDLPARFADLPTGAWELAPVAALVVPLQAGQAPYGFLVVGLDRFRPVDEGYRGFVTLIANNLAAAMTDARAVEFATQRAESLAQLDRAKTDFFTNVSHEFRTPLTLLLGPAEDALADHEEALPARQRQRVEVVHRNAQRMLKLVNNLLDFSRLESGSTTSVFEPVDLAAYTAELADIFASAAERGGLRLVVDCPPQPQPVYVDREQWAKVVLNLVSNAIKYTFTGEVTVAITEDLTSTPGRALLTVTDTGTGIPEEELPLLFQRFQRVHGAPARTHEGSGIGLALVDELVRLHGGSVVASSVVGSGTTFLVDVPLGRAHLPPAQVRGDRTADQTDHRTGDRSDHRTGPADGEVPQLAAEFVTETRRWLEGPSAPEAPPAARDCTDPAGTMSPTDPAGGHRARVLVVDDNADMRGYVADLLGEDYEVVTAADGLEAVEQVGQALPDLVLTDVMMPRLDGFGLLERLRADPRTTGVPVIMLSARAGVDGTIEGLEAGADDYLIKPFSARELLARVRVNLELERVRRVRSILERSQAMLDQAQRMASVGSWEVNILTAAVHASDELLRLLGRTREEFEALGYPEALEALVHPDDLAGVSAAMRQAIEATGSLAYETRVRAAGGDRLLRVRGEVVPDGTGRPQLLRGSVQDITEQREAEEALAAAAARDEAATREHAIADELQRSLLPERSFDLEHLDLATYYRAGVEGTQVGGDWYDVIDLGAGRTAMVVGDVMGRGVTAASFMGQLRSAARAFTKLDLQPSEVLEYLDAIVQDLSGDQIVTCVYAVFDSTDQTLRFANAGHLPPLLVDVGDPVQRLGVAGPPLGAGYFGHTTETVRLHRGTTVTFYTDGLVERRGRDLDVGIESLAQQLCDHADTDVAELPRILLDALVPEGPDDDVALLVARVNADPFQAAVTYHLGEEAPAVAEARAVVGRQLRSWGVPDDIVDDLVLVTSELVTNAFVHGRPPVDLRLRRLGNEVVLEVQDRGTYRPRRRIAADDDENGRGMLIVSMLADAWGTRSIGTGKSVWCTRSFATAPLDRRQIVPADDRRVTAG